MEKENVFTGNLIIDKNSVVKYTEVTGNVEMRPGSRLKAPFLKMIWGHVSIRGRVKFPALKKIGGHVEVPKNAKMEAPALETVGGYVETWARSEIKAQKLKTVGSYVYIGGVAELSSLKTVGGFVRVLEGVLLDIPELDIVGDSIDVREGASLNVPALKTVGNSIGVWTNGVLRANALETVGFCISVRGTAELLSLKTVGGVLITRGNASLKTNKEVRHNVPGAEDECNRKLTRRLKDAGYSFVDGVLANIVSHRGNVWRIIVCGKSEVSYVVSNGEHYSHGKTLKEARDGLMYKVSSRDKSKFKTWTLDRVVSKAEAIEAYRVITGACEAGVRLWVERHKTPDQITVKEIIELTKGAYGNKEFAGFFTTEVAQA